MQNDKLLPCPFCGGEAEYCKGDWIGKEYWVKCTKCSCKTSLSNNYKKPIEEWNTRKPMERIVEQLEKEKEKANERAMTENSIHGHTLDFESFYGQRMAYCQAIEIVKGGVDNAG